MKYYLVDINTDVSTYKSCLVYRFNGSPYVKLSIKKLKDILIGHNPTLNYKILVADINDADLIIMTLSGVVEEVNTMYIEEVLPEILSATASVYLL